jgi:hypothetical protein
MKGTINFTHDTTNDIVIATPNWKIETQEDCELWYQQWVDYLKKFDRKVDCIMVLNTFSVKGDIAEKWGEYRTRVIKDYTRFSYRINVNLLTGIFIKTSGVRYNASSKEAKDIESAIAAIMDERKKADL